MTKEQIKPHIFVKCYKAEFNKPEDEKLKYYYLIKDIIINATTEERMVLYQALYGDNDYFVRTVDDFCAKVNKTKYPTVQQEDIFAQVDLSF